MYFHTLMCEIPKNFLALSLCYQSIFICFIIAWLRKNSRQGIPIITHIFKCGNACPMLKWLSRTGQLNYVLRTLQVKFKYCGTNNFKLITHFLIISFELLTVNGFKNGFGKRAQKRFELIVLCSCWTNTNGQWGIDRITDCAPGKFCVRAR